MNSANLCMCCMCPLLIHSWSSAFFTDVLLAPKRAVSTKSPTRKCCFSSYHISCFQLRKVLSGDLFAQKSTQRNVHLFPRGQMSTNFFVVKRCEFFLSSVGINGLVFLLFLCRMENLINQWALENVLIEICHTFNIYYSGIGTSLVLLVLLSGICTNKMIVLFQCRMESITNYKIKNQNQDKIFWKILQITKSNHVLNNTQVLFFTQTIYLDQKSNESKIITYDLNN